MGQFYLKIQGTKQGKFHGDSPKANRRDWIELSGFQMEATVPLDAAGGVASGKRQHRPIVVTKPVGTSTPQLVQAWQTKETLSEVVIEGTHSGSESIASRVVLTQAQIINYAAATHGANDFTIAFQTIRKDWTK
jgi:type VI secretion system secreted protein Hcp